MLTNFSIIFTRTSRSSALHRARCCLDAVKTPPASPEAAPKTGPSQGSIYVLSSQWIGSQWTGAQSSSSAFPKSLIFLR